MIIENKEMGIRFEVDNQQDFDKWYAIRKEQIRAEVIDKFVKELENVDKKSGGLGIDIIDVWDVAEQLNEGK